MPRNPHPTDAEINLANLRQALTDHIKEGREFVRFHDIDAVSILRLREWLDILEAALNQSESYH